MKPKYNTPLISISGTGVNRRLFALSLIQQPMVTFKDVEFQVVNDKDKSEGGDWDQNWLN